ncbi:MAG: exonuclease SbcCD subunit D C-terminal domain-containing protein [Methylomicrobium sp.]|nr:exonuclease SbcCD subunit D C-terminal domain-containing protein [Methylomicrobium sp.]
MDPMKLLHTSDWHLGRTLYGRKRYEEFEAFLIWLADTVEQHHVDVLLVAGDVFDTNTPSNRAQELYYRFLCRVASLKTCRHIVLIAGNHDSPAFLNAPKALLKSLDVHVIGSVTDKPEDEVIVLSTQDGVPELIVCAVPYLRDRDIRSVEAGESIVDKELKLIEGIRQHYAEVTALAEQKRQMLGRDIPIIGMGHLFAAGGQTVEGDGVRELYVGSLAHVSAGIFPACLDYLALGHLHVPQRVNNSELMRYSGSPLPMGFGEAKQEKSICLVQFAETKAQVTLINVPVFQRLEQIRGSWDTLSTRILELAAAGTRVWLEVVYDGEEVIGDLRERLESAVSGSAIEILRIKNNRIIDRILNQMEEGEKLDDLTVDDVFARCLIAHDIPEDQRKALLLTYQEAVISLAEDPMRAE